MLVLCAVTASINRAISDLANWYIDRLLKAPTSRYHEQNIVKKQVFMEPYYNSKYNLYFFIDMYQAVKKNIVKNQTVYI